MPAYMIAIAAILGGWISRMCGGGWPKLPWGLDQWIYALPYAGVYFLLPWAWYINLPVAAAAYGLGFLGKRMGHGQYFHLNYSPRENEEQDEKIDPFVSLFFGKDLGGHGRKRYWRGVFGLSITGLICALGAGVALGVAGHYIASAVILAGGIAKAGAYMLGWWAYSQVKARGLLTDPAEADRIKNIWDKAFIPTVWGEIITGTIGWASALYAYHLAGIGWPLT